MSKDVTGEANIIETRMPTLKPESTEGHRWTA